MTALTVTSNKCVPGNILNLFKDRDAPHDFNLRGTSKLHRPNVRTTLKTVCSVRGVILWNNLSEELKNVQTFFSLRESLKCESQWDSPG